MFAMNVYRRPHKGNEAPGKELCLVHHDGGRILERTPCQHVHQPVNGYRVSRNGRTIVVDDRGHFTTVPIVNIGRQHENFFVETSIAPNNALDFAGFTSKHGAYNYAKRHC